MYFKGGKRVEDATLAGANVDALMVSTSFPIPPRVTGM